VHASKIIAAILKPVLPQWAAKMERMLRLGAPLDFINAAEPLAAGHSLSEYEILAEPIDPSKIAAIIEDSKSSMGTTDSADSTGPSFDYEVPPLAPEASIDQFEPIDLRVGEVIECRNVEGAKKLLQLTVDLGPLGRRSVFSGIALSYAAEALVGKRVAVFANLKPRKMRFGLSEGMILASGETDDTVTIVELDPRAKLGAKIT
jgi:methionyl-tRNA synthetase